MQDPVIYAFSGLGADERVFEYLDLKLKLIPVKWLTPEKDEDIREYAIRLFKDIEISKSFYFLGVSFGGLIAVELSKIYTPLGTILISSVEVKSDFRSLYLAVGKMRILSHLPVFFFNLKPFLANIIFGAQNKRLLREILIDTDPTFLKWAVGQLTKWDNVDEIANCLKINGGKDLMIPSRKNRGQIIIKEGTHFMVVDRAYEINGIVNTFLEK